MTGLHCIMLRGSLGRAAFEGNRVGVVLDWMLTHDVNAPAQVHARKARALRTSTRLLSARDPQLSNWIYPRKHYIKE